MKMGETLLEADEGSAISCGALWEYEDPGWLGVILSRPTKTVLITITIIHLGHPGPIVLLLISEEDFWIIMMVVMVTILTTMVLTLATLVQ